MLARFHVAFTKIFNSDLDQAAACAVTFHRILRAQSSGPYSALGSPAAAASPVALGEAQAQGVTLFNLQGRTASQSDNTVTAGQLPLTDGAMSDPSVSASHVKIRKA